MFGTVSDQTGAVVPGAAVRLADEDRGSALETATGSAGFFNFADIRPGHYRIEVEKERVQTRPFDGDFSECPG